MIRYYLQLINYLLFRRRYLKEWGVSSAVVESCEKHDKKIVFMCDGYKGHGGLSDRMRGLLTTYYEAKTRKIPFFIYWTDPFELSDFLVPNGVCDWRIDAKEIFYDYERSFPLIMDISSTHGKNIIKEKIFKHCLRDKRDILVYSNMMYVKKGLPQLYNELFKPSDYLQENIEEHIRKIGTPYWSYTFRFGNFLGDFKDIVGYPLVESEKKRLVDKNISELKRLLRELPSGYKALVTSDSLFFLEQVQAADDRIYVIKKELRHVDFSKSEKKEIWLKSFLDQNLIMKAEKVFLLRTEGMYPSSFPAFAALIGEKEFIHHDF